MSERLVNEQIGARVRLYRTACGVSRARLAESLGVSPQQIQKYETGGNRIPAARLAVIAAVLDREVQDFFVDAGGGADDLLHPADSRRLQRRRSIVRAVERLEAMPEAMRTQILGLIRSAAPASAQNRDG